MALKQMVKHGPVGHGAVKVLQPAIRQVVQNVEAILREEAHKLRLVVDQGVCHGVFQMLRAWNMETRNRKSTHLSSIVILSKRRTCRQSTLGPASPSPSEEDWAVGAEDRFSRTSLRKSASPPEPASTSQGMEVFRERSTLWWKITKDHFFNTVMNERSPQEVMDEQGLVCGQQESRDVFWTWYLAGKLPCKSKKQGSYDRARVDQLLSVVDEAPGSDTQRHHLVERHRRGCGGMIPHRLSNTLAHTFTQTGRQDPRSWEEQTNSEGRRNQKLPCLRTSRTQVFTFVLPSPPTIETTRTEQKATHIAVPLAGSCKLQLPKRISGIFRGVLGADPAVDNRCAEVVAKSHRAVVISRTPALTSRAITEREYMNVVIQKSMDVDLEGIIQCIKQGDESGVQTQLEEFNKEYAQCFFFDSEERDKRKFRKNKVRDYADSDSEEYDQDDPGLILRQNLALVLVRYIRAEVKCPLLRVSLRTLRILSRDKKVLGPLVTDSALLALAKLAGLTQSDASDDTSDSDFYDNILASLAEAKVLPCGTEEDGGDIEANDQEEDFFEEDTISTAEGIHPNVLERGKKDRRVSKIGGEEEEEGGESGEEAQRKEAMKVLCNVVYNSSWAQERFSALRLICGLTARLSSAVSFSSPSSVHFYELRLMFLMTALRRELSTQLQKEGGVSIFTAALESCLQVQWKEQYECVLDPAAPPISLEASQRIIEILKILFNITHSAHRQEPSEDDAALYRHLVAILRLCLMKQCLLSDDTDELQGHTVNLLSALPLQCLDVMLTVPLEPDSMQCQGSTWTVFRPC
ncbi:hypothetical protein F7725_014216 [Dissostichus mawsoni]|uniref:Synembryn n=1 Tax=Dissostichus mawsoni TaxID=36200 RepID=A0A7J5YZN5_DISMA|nr:hypothetical protein F7725_014216 [Dissostichus mawsoni]